MFRVESAQPSICRDQAKKRGIFRFPGVMVEAAGQLIHGFRHGLDYAFILLPGCGACYSLLFQRILVSARRFPDRRIYESLQGRPEVGPLPTPRRCHSALQRSQGSPM